MHRVPESPAAAELTPTETFTISAQAAEGYYFDKWNGNGIQTSTSEILKIWMDQV